MDRSYLLSLLIIDEKKWDTGMSPYIYILYKTVHWAKFCVDMLALLELNKKNSLDIIIFTIIFLQTIMTVYNW